MIRLPKTLQQAALALVAGAALLASFLLGRSVLAPSGGAPAQTPPILRPLVVPVVALARPDPLERPRSERVVAVRAAPAPRPAVHVPAAEETDLDALLADLMDGPAWRRDAFVGDGAWFGSALAARPAVDVVEGEPSQPLADGTLVRLGAGRIRLGTGIGWSGASAPADLVIAGAGMDETVLTVSTILSLSPVQRLTLRDLTLDLREGPLADLRGSAPSTIRLERVRLRGFDRGRGASAAVIGDHLAVHATDCRFEAGAGGAPGTGTLFASRGPLLVRVERCRIEGPLRTLADVGPEARLVFVQPTFVGASDRVRAEVSSPSPWMRLEGVTWATATAEEEVRS